MCQGPVDKDRPEKKQCAKRRSVCIHLFLLVRDLCLKLGAVVLIGDSNKNAERQAPSGDSGDRRISPLEDAFKYACVPWPTPCVTPLWGPGGELYDSKWMECCGFEEPECGTPRSTSNPVTSVWSSPTTRGTTSTSKFLAVIAEGTRPRLIRMPGVAICSLLHTTCDRRHAGVQVAPPRFGGTCVALGGEICVVPFSCAAVSVRAGNVVARCLSCLFFVITVRPAYLLRPLFSQCFHEQDVRRTSCRPLHRLF